MPAAARPRLAALGLGLGVVLGLPLAASGVTVVDASGQALPAPPPAAEAEARPRVGLVLGGGGARGAAHIGVLEVLDRLRIPVDCVAGTSMGALVAGAWAAGADPQEMRQAMARADWPDMFQDNPDYADLNYRNKRLLQRYLPGSETGITARGAVSPPGVVSGQKIKLFINQLVRADAGERGIESLPLPLSIIATDIGTGQRVAYREGSLTQAMRASMAVPGLLAPVEYGGRKLVDGGLVDNLPIAEVRERCRADVVIAVNVGSPLLKPEQVNGLLSISAQMVALLTEQNVSASLATLRPGDIVVQPELGEITAADFERHAEAADRGRAAMEAPAVLARLRPLAVDAPRYAAWRRRLDGRELPTPRVDEIDIAGLERVNPAVVRRYIAQRSGEPLDTAALNRDLLRAYGDGHYEGVDYSLQTVRGRNVLRVTPLEKSWGPDYLRLALKLDSSFSQGSTYALRAAYQKTWLNRLGGELLLSGEIGSTTGAGVEFYQPLDAAQRFFVDAQAEYRRERADLYYQRQRISEYRVARSTGTLSMGLNFSLVGELRLGWRDTQISTSLETGLPLFPIEGRRGSRGWIATLDMDQLDRLYFPRRGWQLRSSVFTSAEGDYSRFALDARSALPLGRTVIGTRYAMVSSPRGRLPLEDAATLGGFLNLSAYASGQLVGDGLHYAQLRTERIIGRLPLGLRGDMRLGLALEAGKIGSPYTVQVRDGWLRSLGVYVGGETPVGPVYVGLARANGGVTNAYLFLGIP